MNVKRGTGLMLYIGYLSAILLSTCGIFQLVHTVEQGFLGEDFSLYFLLAWFLGEVLGLFYVTKLRSVPLMLNYLINLIVSGTLLYYYYK